MKVLFIVTLECIFLNARVTHAFSHHLSPLCLSSFGSSCFPRIFFFLSPSPAPALLPGNGDHKWLPDTFHNKPLTITWESFSEAWFSHSHASELEKHFTSLVHWMCSYHLTRHTHRKLTVQHGNSNFCFLSTFLPHLSIASWVHHCVYSIKCDHSILRHLFKSISEQWTLTISASVNKLPIEMICYFLPLFSCRQWLKWHRSRTIGIVSFPSPGSMCFLFHSFFSSFHLISSCESRWCLRSPPGTQVRAQRREYFPLSLITPYAEADRIGKSHFLSLAWVLTSFTHFTKHRKKEAPAAKSARKLMRIFSLQPLSVLRFLLLFLSLPCSCCYFLDRPSRSCSSLESSCLLRVQAMRWRNVHWATWWYL